MRAVYQINVRTFFRVITQYAHISRNSDLYLEEVDAKTRGLFNQFFFSYTINPQTVFFFGYSDNYRGYAEFAGIDSLGLTQSDRTVFTKVGYAWSF